MIEDEKTAQPGGFSDKYKLYQHRVHHGADGNMV